MIALRTTREMICEQIHERIIDTIFDSHLWEKKKKKRPLLGIKTLPNKLTFKKYLETSILITSVKSIIPSCSSTSDECGGRWAELDLPQIGNH